MFFFYTPSRRLGTPGRCAEPAARIMATPGGLKFLNDINNRNVLQVQHALRKGHAHPNQNYLSVYPLNLAIENVRLGSRAG